MMTLPPIKTGQGFLFYKGPVVKETDTHLIVDDREGRTTIQKSAIVAITNIGEWLR